MKCMLLSAYCALIWNWKILAWLGRWTISRFYLRLFMSSLVKILQHAWQSTA